MSSKKTPVSLSIIVVSFNTRQILFQCLKSLGKAVGKIPAEIIVIDNASEDGSAAMVKKSFPQIKLVRNKTNLGFGRANNQGAQLARGKFLLFLNSDTLCPPSSLAKLTRLAQKQENLGALGPGLLNSDHSPQSSAGPFPLLPIAFLMLFAERFCFSRLVRASFSKTSAVDWVMGAAFLMPRRVWQQFSWDEGLFMYMEEVELCYRLRQAGFKVIFSPRVKITHLGQASSRGRTGPILNIYRGLNYFYLKHRSPFEQNVLKLMLKTKAVLAFGLGAILGSRYLQKTYREAFKIS